MQKLGLLTAAAVLATALGFNGTAKADSIAIANPSFEDPELAEDAIGKATDWNDNGTFIGAFNPEEGAFDAAPCTNPDPTPAFMAGITGDQVGYSNDGNDFSQETIATITGGSRYTLKVFVGGRCDGLANQAYTVQILAGGVPVASKSGFNVANTWFEETVIYDSPSDDPNAGQRIGVALNNDGGNQLNWDMVTLDVTKIVTPVSIDIKPGSDPNSINLCSAGVIPVAILGSEDFDVALITDEDIGHLRLGDASVKMVGKVGKEKTLCSTEDVDADGYDDLVCKFLTVELVESTGTMSIDVHGTIEGADFTGNDSVNIVKDDCL